jgi:hypothetical protein
MAVAYDTHKQAATLIHRNEWKGVLEAFAEQIERGDGEAIVSLAELMQAFVDEDIRAQMEDFLQDRFDESPPGPVRDAYGVAASYYNSFAKEAIIQIPPSYEMMNWNELSQQRLFGTDGIHRQLMVFSDDKDGHNSYAHMLGYYLGNNNYEIEDKGTYNKITSVRGQYKVELYMNHPDQNPDDIISDLAGDKDALVEDIEIEAVIHRGHSYNLANTLPYISSNNSLLFLGSCGSFNNVSHLLDIAPEAHIIATKQTGTMFVNDPMLYNVNETIRTEGVIDWYDQQSYLDSLHDSRKSAYILPHRNIALAITYKLKDLAAKKLLQSSSEPEYSIPEF